MAILAQNLERGTPLLFVVVPPPVVAPVLLAAAVPGAATWTTWPPLKLGSRWTLAASPDESWADCWTSVDPQVVGGGGLRSQATALSGPNGSHPPGEPCVLCWASAGRLSRRREIDPCRRLSDFKRLCRFGTGFLSWPRGFGNPKVGWLGGDSGSGGLPPGVVGAQGRRPVPGFYGFVREGDFTL